MFKKTLLIHDFLGNLKHRYVLPYTLKQWFYLAYFHENIL